MPALPTGKAGSRRRVTMYAYTSNQTNKEDGMPETCSKISILRFSDVWINAYSSQ